MKLFQQVSIVLAVLLMAGCATTETLEPTASGDGPTGSAEAEVWENLGGRDIGDLYNSPNFPDSPSMTVNIPELKVKNGYTNYGVRVRAYLYPPETGEYLFKINAPDAGEFWISADESSTGKYKLIQVPDPNVSGNNVEAKRTVYLEQGKRYYVEILNKGDTSSDQINTRWQLPSQPGTWSAITEISPFIPELDDGPSDEFMMGFRSGYSEGYGDAETGLDYDDSYPPADSDFDGVPDKWELMFGYDPNDYFDMGYDDDGDGLSGYEEFVYGTSPLNPDTNGDGKSDGQHIADGTDPTEGGGSDPTDPPPDATDPPPDDTDPPPAAGGSSMYVTWDTPTTRADGSALSVGEISHFIISYGISQDALVNSVRVDEPTATSFTIPDLAPGVYYVSIVVFDTDGVPSDPSAVKPHTVQ
ncbi:PA14 domain-containing protein [Corallincola platygyrae]|uniref:PA14 domain-containing protein n=1 Tax=Corallincola platygyrae TaxID=1193278 RepID=A0ABW4XMC9_9GAMM